MPKPKYQRFDIDWRAQSAPADPSTPDAYMDDLITSLDLDTTLHPSKRFKSSEVVRIPPSGKPTIDLPVEIILNIVEQMGWDPISIGKFMRSSSTSANTILHHEPSLCLSFAANVPHDNKPILSSAPTLSAYAPSIHTDAVQATLKRIVASHIPASRTFGRPEPVTPPSWDSFRDMFYRTMALLHPTTAIAATSATITAQREAEIEKQILDAWNEAYAHWVPRHNLSLAWQTDGQADSRISFLADNNPAKFLALPKVATPLRLNSFEWIEELHLREKIKDFLPKSRLLDCKYADPRTRAIYHTPQAIDDRCDEGIETFKAGGIDILYQMWDARILSSAQASAGSCGEDNCTAPKECEARHNVDAWIRQQSENTLAALLQIVWIASQLYEPPSLLPRETEVRCEHGGHDPYSNQDHPSQSLAEMTNQWEIVERQCIFRELCFESGPWFMYACRAIGPRAGAREKEVGGWARSRLDRGVQRLHAYESGAPLEEEAEESSDSDSWTGAPMSRMTLQATLLTRFCELRLCDLTHGWDEVFFVNAVAIATTQQEIDERRAKEKRAKELEQREMAKKWKKVVEKADKKIEPVWTAGVKAALKEQAEEAS